MKVRLIHLAPGEGTINWREVLEALKKVNYEDVFMIEAVFSKHTGSPDAVAEKSREISDRLIKKYLG